MQSPQSTGGAPGRGAAEHLSSAILAAIVAVVAPLLLYQFTFPHEADDVWLIPWVLAPIIGPMVFQLISRPRPKLRYGLALAGVLAVVFGVWAAVNVPFKEPGTWPADQRVAIGLYFFFLTFVAGALGASIALFLTRLTGFGRAWQVGAIVAALDAVVTAILVAVFR